MLRTKTCGELNNSNISETVTLSGWVQKNRDLGGMTFIDLRDRYGITQLAFNMDNNSDLYEKARKLGREFVIQVKGEVIERSSKNMNISTGEIEIKVSELTILNESKTPPFTIEDKTDGGDELRMKYRYLDIRRNPIKENIMLRTKTCGELNNSNVSEKITLCGWVQKTRDLGGMTFVDLRDRYGITQLAFNMEDNSDL